MNAILEAALRYASRGWPVFPCATRSKKPLTAHGCKNATTEPTQIEAWWRRWPSANVAIATGPRSFDALDIDGPEGEQSLSALEDRFGPIPDGPRQQTGRGRQLFFQGGTLGNSAGRVPGLDTRGEGGYVVAAPSIHPNGSTYAMGFEHESLPAPPQWLLDALVGNGSSSFIPSDTPAAVEDDLARTVLEMAGIPLVRVVEGQRNDQLFRWGASLRARGQEVDAIYRVLKLANDHLCDPPLDDCEIQRISASASRLDVSLTYARANETIDSIVKKAAIKQADVEDARVLESVATSDDRLGKLREAMGIPLLRVIRTGARPARYHLVVECNGAPLELPIKNLLSYEDVRHAVFDALGVAIAVKRKNWNACAGLLHAIAKYEEPGLADPPEEIRHYLERYLVESKESLSIAKTREAFDERRFLYENRIEFEGDTYIRFDAFRDFCNLCGMKDSVQVLWGRLKESGTVIEVPRVFWFNGRVVRRAYWQVALTYPAYPGPP